MEDIKICFLKGLSAEKVEKSAACIELKVNSISGHQINLQYSTITGNCPMSFGNKIHIWKGDGVKWGVKPYKTFDIPSDDQDGQFLIEGINIGKNSFTVGYSVGPSAEQTVACIIFPEGAEKPEECEYYTTSIAVEGVNDSSVSYSYKTLEGFTPNMHGAQVGIWERKRVPYPAKNPLSQIIVKFDAEEGMDTISKLELASGQDYCLGLLFPIDGQSNATYLAASCTFKY